jgi:hypothetical protein
LDRQWIAATDKFANEINARIQEWRREGGATILGLSRARSQIRRPLPQARGFPEGCQLDFIERLDTPDLRPHEFDVSFGDSFILLRNIDTGHGLAKRKRYVAVGMHGLTIVLHFENGQEITFSRIALGKDFNAMRFVPW